MSKPNTKAKPITIAPRKSSNHDEPVGIVVKHLSMEQYNAEIKADRQAAESRNWQDWWNGEEKRGQA
jgi:hypothetical protein